MLHGSGSPFSCAVSRGQMDNNSPAVLSVTASPQSPTMNRQVKVLWPSRGQDYDHRISCRVRLTMLSL